MRRVSLAELFLGFSEIGLSGFGGVLPWARRIIVERRGWLGSEEFTAMLGLCQFLPGPNVVNLAVVVGRRFQGAAGAVVAPLGLLLAPFAIVIILAILYDRFSGVPEVQAMLRGMAAVGAGLIIATGLKMGADLRRRPWALALTALMFVLVAVFRWPLPLAMLALTPVSIALAAWLSR
jgi:chromate transporter